MKKKVNKNYVLIFTLTTFIFFSKYFNSFFLFNEDYIITKILLETSDIQYYPLVESLSRFDLSPSFSKYFTPQKIITFPILSIIWHAIFFKFLNYYSFIVLEFIFKFLTFLVLYKIFKKLDINSICSIFFSFLILILPSFINFIELVDFKNLDLVGRLVNANLGYRFPRPLVTFLYLNIFLFFLLCYFNNKFKKKKIFLFLPLSIVLIFLANSFFYLFISCSLLLLLLLIINLKKNFFSFFKENILILLFSFILVLFGVSIILFQSIFGEVDYSRRIGLFEINFNEKIFLLRYFFLSFIKYEIIALFFLSLILKFFSKQVLLKKNIIDKINIFFYLFLCSIISPFLFVLLFPKVISLYHFFDLIIFTGIYYIFFYFIVFFYFRFNNFFTKVTFVYILYCTCFFLIFLNNKFTTINVDERQDINLINTFLLKNNINSTNKVLFTDDLRIINLWLYHKNKYLSVPEGFSNSLNDTQIEKSLFLLFKSLDINNNEFKNFLNLKSEDGRNFFSLFLFNYKYQANS